MAPADRCAEDPVPRHARGVNAGAVGAIDSIDAEEPEDGGHWAWESLRAGGQPAQDWGRAGELVSGLVAGLPTAGAQR